VEEPVQAGGPPLRTHRSQPSRHRNQQSQITIGGSGLRQHAGLADPLVVVLDLSSPIIEDRDIAAMLYGRTATTMLDRPPR
jgi:hypothetical protein